VDMHMLVGPNSTLEKTSFGKGEYSLDQLPIHANRHGNPTIPSKVRKRSLSRWLLTTTTLVVNDVTALSWR
jgi:hypothetical protein